MEIEDIWTEVGKRYRFKSMAGQVLVAVQSMDESCFEKSLIYVCSHDESGAIGVIINHRIGSLMLKDSLDDLEGGGKRASKPFPLVFGGPVESNRFVVLSLNKNQKRDFKINQELTVYTDCDKFLSDYIVKKCSDKFLIAKGIASWEPYQLECELANNLWMVTEPTTEMIFSQRIKNKWGRVVKQMGLDNMSNMVYYSGEA